MSSENTTPLITFTKPDNGGVAGGGDSWRWWKKVLDWEEAKNQILFSLPMILTNVAYYCIPLVSVMFAGHLGEVELSASNLANSWASVTGFSFMCKYRSNRVHVNYGVSAAASTCVSNELGAGNIERAKHAMAVTLKLSVILVVAVVLALGFGHDIWAGFFSNSSVIINQFASMTPLLVISIFLDSIQGVLSGVARGCGWQHLAVYVNLAMFYLIGMPIAVVLAFLLKLYAKGLWIGLICGVSCQTGGLLLLVYLNKWTGIELNGSNGLADTILV